MRESHRTSPMFCPGDTAELRRRVALAGSVAGAAPAIARTMAEAV